MSVILVFLHVLIYVHNFNKLFLAFKKIYELLYLKADFKHNLRRLKKKNTESLSTICWQFGCQYFFRKLTTNCIFNLSFLYIFAGKWLWFYKAFEQIILTLKLPADCAKTFYVDALKRFEIKILILRYFDTTLNSLIA